MAEVAALSSLREQVEQIERLNQRAGYPVPEGALICLPYPEARALLDHVTDKVRAWVKEVAYAEDDFVVEEADVKALLDSLDPNWREVFTTPYGEGQRCQSPGCTRSGHIKSEQWGKYLCPSHALTGPEGES